jgi:hypothetical protein
MSDNRSPSLSGITACFGNATFSAISGAATTTYTSAAVPFTINGKYTTFAAQTTVAFPTTDTNTAAQFTGLVKASTGTVFVLGVNYGGTTLRALQGSVENLDAAGNFIGANVPKFPSMPDDFCPLGYIVAKAGSTFVATAWYPGTTNWNTTGMTYSIVNVASLPDRPQVA